MSCTHQVLAAVVAVLVVVALSSDTAAEARSVAAEVQKQEATHEYVSWLLQQLANDYYQNPQYKPQDIWKIVGEIVQSSSIGGGGEYPSYGEDGLRQTVRGSSEDALQNLRQYGMAQYATAAGGAKKRKL